jgi:dihydroxyacetone kinase
MTINDQRIADHMLLRFMLIHSQILSQNPEQNAIAPRGADATKNTVLLKGGGSGRTVPVL